MTHEQRESEGENWVRWLSKQTGKLSSADGWYARAEIAIAEREELNAEIERLRLEIEGDKMAGSILSGLTAALSGQPREARVQPQ